MNRWPDVPLIPLEWADETKYHPQVVVAIAEGFCPKHLGGLSPIDGFCPSCNVGWELTVSTGTAPTTAAVRWPRFAVTDGMTVLVSREL